MVTEYGEFGLDACRSMVALGDVSFTLDLDPSHVTPRRGSVTSVTSACSASSITSRESFYHVLKQRPRGSHVTLTHVTQTDVSGLLGREEISVLFQCIDDWQVSNLVILYMIISR